MSTVVTVLKRRLTADYHQHFNDFTVLKVVLFSLLKNVLFNNSAADTSFFSAAVD